MLTHYHIMTPLSASKRNNSWFFVWKMEDLLLRNFWRLLFLTEATAAAAPIFRQPTTFKQNDFIKWQRSNTTIYPFEWPYIRFWAFPLTIFSKIWNNCIIVFMCFRCKNSYNTRINTQYLNSNQFYVRKPRIIDFWEMVFAITKSG